MHSLAAYLFAPCHLAAVGACAPLTDFLPFVRVALDKTDFPLAALIRHQLHLFEPVGEIQWRTLTLLPNMFLFRSEVMAPSTSSPCWSQTSWTVAVCDCWSGYFIAHDRICVREHTRRRRKQTQFRGATKHLDNFDFQFNPRMNRSLVFDLATAGWVGRREDSLFLGVAAVRATSRRPSDAPSVDRTRTLCGC